MLPKLEFRASRRNSPPPRPRSPPATHESHPAGSHTGKPTRARTGTQPHKPPAPPSHRSDHYEHAESHAAPPALTNPQRSRTDSTTLGSAVPGSMPAGLVSDGAAIRCCRGINAPRHSTSPGRSGHDQPDFPRHAVVPMRGPGEQPRLQSEYQARDGEPGSKLQSPRRRGGRQPPSRQRFASPGVRERGQPWPSPRLVRSNPGSRGHRGGIPVCASSQTRPHPRTGCQVRAGRRRHRDGARASSRHRATAAYSTGRRQPGSKPARAQRQSASNSPGPRPTSTPP